MERSQRSVSVSEIRIVDPSATNFGALIIGTGFWGLVQCIYIGAIIQGVLFVFLLAPIVPQGARQGTPLRGQGQLPSAQGFGRRASKHRENSEP